MLETTRIRNDDNDDEGDQEEIKTCHGRARGEGAVPFPGSRLRNGPLSFTLRMASLFASFSSRLLGVNVISSLLFSHE